MQDAYAVFPKTQDPRPKTQNPTVSIFPSCRNHFNFDHFNGIEKMPPVRRVP